MRSLSGTLLAAQQAASMQPAVSVTLRPASGMRDRLTFGQVHTLTSLPSGTPQVAVLASLGVLYVYALDPPTGTLSVRTVTAGGLESVPVTLATFASLPTFLRLCQTPSGIACLLTGGTLTHPQLTTFTSLVGGGRLDTSVAGWTHTGGLVGQALALACAPSGRLGIFGWGSDGTLNYRTALVQTAAGTGWPASFAALATGSIVAPSQFCATYTGDWLIVACGFSLFDAADLSEVLLYGYGDGGQLAAATWSAPQAIVATAPSGYLGTSVAGTTLAVGGVCQCAQAVVTLFETFLGGYPTGAGTSGAYTISRGYLTSVADAAGWLAGNSREPQALPAGVSGAALAACDATLAHWLLDGTTVWLSPAVATVDYSARVLRVKRTEAEHGGSVSVLLDDSDGALTRLAADPATIGQRLSVAFGYVTSTGSAEYSAGGDCWVSSATCLWDGTQRTLELMGHDGAALLAGWRPRRAFAWLPGQSTLSQIIGYVCGRAGLAYSAPGSPSTLLGEQPAYIVRAGTDGLRTVLDLLSRAPECLRLSAAGASLVQPWLSVTPVYAYGVGGAHAVVAARATVHGQAVNHVLVLGVATSAVVPQLLAEAQDDGDQYAEGPLVEVVRDMQLSGLYGPARVVSAGLRAAAVLQKAQLVGDAGEIVTAPNVGLEIWDQVAVTCAALGWAGTVLCVREIQTLFARDRGSGGVYSQSVGLMPSATGVRI